MKQRKFLLVAGEESGDLYAGRICRHILKLAPNIRIEGLGGERLRQAGGATLYDISRVSSVGVASMIGKLRFIKSALDDFRGRIAASEYDAAILIDYPDFNVRIAKACDAAGVPVFYYVCPQFWAWRRYRIKSVGRLVDMMIVALPFEEELYEKNGVRAHFVGHPLLDELQPVADPGAIREELGIGPRHTMLGLMPGSRNGEVVRILPPMIDAVKIIKASKPVKVVIPCADSIDPALVKRIVGEMGEEAVVVAGKTWEVINACDFLICKSGTSTLQATIAGAPMVIVYKSDWFSYLLIRSISHVKWAGLPNLLAQKEIVPELIQGEMTPSNIAKTALPFLHDPSRRESMKKELGKVAATLGAPGGSSRAADLIMDYMKSFGQ